MANFDNWIDVQKVSWAIAGAKRIPLMDVQYHFVISCAVGRSCNRNLAGFTDEDDASS